jgi:fructose-bisphosphate aldolase, class II
MPIATVEQYSEMLDAASAGGHALAAVNVSSSTTLNAVMRGFAEAGADGIVQITTGGAEYASGAARDMALGARALAEFAHVLGPRYPVAIALHTDHATPDRFEPYVRPLLAETARRLAAGESPLFNSHMFDGSSLPLEENLRRASPLLDELAALGLVLEVECGVIGGEEDGVSGHGELYTTAADLLRVAEALGTGERGRYLLAAAFGNVHGVHAPGDVRLRPELLAEGQAALAQAHPGARFQYVFHGGSGSSDEDLRAAIAGGVVKFNLDTSGQYAYTRSVADHMLKHYDEVMAVDGGVGNKAAYDPRAWGRKAEAALAAHVAETTQRLRSAGRSVITRA